VEFIGRREELERLGRFVASTEPAIAAVFGRRRIGKSSLIRQALQGRKALFFDALEERPRREQIAHFMFQLQQQLESSDSPRFPASVAPPASWKEAFLVLFEAIKDEPRPVVFDELQWMANYRHELVSDLKYVWDGFFARLPGQKLILCGSIASFMINKVIKSSALYGRVDAQIRLTGFSVAETCELLKGRGADEILHAHMVTAGVPKYLRLLSEYPSIQLAIQDLAFTPNGYLTTEYERIFTSHFGKKPHFAKLVRALAEHPLGLYRDDLARSAGVSLGGQLSQHLRDLESAGFISVVTPFNRSDESRHIKYFLNDAYLRFYFGFIRPNLQKIRMRRATNIFNSISTSGAYHAWMGRSFEYLCLQHADLLARELGFAGIDFTAGPYFSPAKGKSAAVQVDLLFDRADDVMTVCEMKYSRHPPGIEVIDEMEKKLALLAQIAARKTLQRVLIVRGKVSQDLMAAGYFYRIIDASEIFLR
jgi:AAA+ ATPase superfamily predicted ATPase